MKNWRLFILMMIFLASCGEDEKPLIDTEYPEILVEDDSFPLQCSVIERGTTLEFKAYFSDNVELGSYSLDIHHNFDHHTHSTEVNSCNEDPIKTPVNPLLLIQTFTIPEGLTEYVGTAEIEIPADIDPGDYHFMIRLTDQEGWQTLQGLSIKIE
ncbi:DUF4625 domain-containing protein [Echinicola sp. CAU 1574]|uniref:DUF4625 domain-containing protein n=1 Tax=Echinicola arenosa TaxID=2774144 RepID=A0ABR9AHA9_9BACT|nr:DUF4625 domain-containing protein [Echinicola arenosa]MBD8488235.1 DUF4625 domain-containing protein [Echinicola arenosa]